VAWLALGCAGNCDYNTVVDGLIKLQHVMFCLHASIEVCVRFRDDCAVRSPSVISFRYETQVPR
jgi:hypothetical protein